MNNSTDRHDTMHRLRPWEDGVLRSGASVIRHDPVDADSIAERILAAKADGIHHEPPEHMTLEAAHFPATKPKPTLKTRR